MLRKFIILILLLIVAPVFGCNNSPPKLEITKNNLPATAIGDNVDKAQAFISLYGKWVWIALGFLILLYIGLKLFRKGRDRTT